VIKELPLLFERRFDFYNLTLRVSTVTAGSPAKCRATVVKDQGMINIFVGNIGADVTEEQLRDLFAVHGVVTSVRFVNDRDTAQPRGFAFVEMNSIDDAKRAVASLDGATLNGRELRVNEARPKAEEDPSRPSSDARDHRRHRI
jgi:RNA recognition motif-containing protein